MKQIENYEIIKTKNEVKHMKQTYEMSEQEALDSLRNITLRVKKLFPLLSIKEILIILYLSIYVE